MVAAGDFKNGITVEIDGNIYQILEFQHVKPGKGAAFVRTKLKNIISGGVVEKTFRPTEKFENAHIDRKDMQYLYKDGDLYNFMDVETYDQIALDSEVVGDALKFVKEFCNNEYDCKSRYHNAERCAKCAEKTSCLHADVRRNVYSKGTGRAFADRNKVDDLLFC